MKREQKRIAKEKRVAKLIKALQAEGEIEIFLGSDRRSCVQASFDSCCLNGEQIQINARIFFPESLAKRVKL